MTRRIFPYALHALFITWLLNQEADDFLQAVVDLSQDADFYEHDSIIAGYVHTAPLNFTFLEAPFYSDTLQQVLILIMTIS